MFYKYYKLLYIEVLHNLNEKFGRKSYHNF